jgi:hypothetical protein
LNPYPPHYRTAFAFSDLLCPHPHRRTLRFAFPEGEIRVYQVPLISPDDLGSAFPPGDFTVTQDETRAS